MSRASTLNWKRTNRDIHVLASSERNFALLAMYNPDTFDIHEQKLLSPQSRPHPMFNHPVHGGRLLPNLLGTIEAYDQLGLLKFIPKFTIEVNGERQVVPIAQTGDLLIFVKPENEDAFCVNWSIKLSADDFSERNRGKLKTNKQKDADLRKSDARHESEKVYYSHAGIRTVQLASDWLDPNVCSNLSMLFSWHSRPVSLDCNLQSDLIDALRQGLSSGATALEIISRFVPYAPKQRDQLSCVYHQAIWSRLLAVDLFSPILIDRPMHREKKCVLEHYSDFFKEIV